MKAVPTDEIGKERSRSGGIMNKSFVMVVLALTVSLAQESAAQYVVYYPSQGYYQAQIPANWPVATPGVAQCRELPQL
jgi:hypothetical protein